MVRRLLSATASVLLLAACGPGAADVAASPTANPAATAPATNPGFGSWVARPSGTGSLEGVWSQLPRSGLSDRYTANVAWTGRYLFVWGGAAGKNRDVERGDGAAWDVTTGKWQALPPSPLTARTDSAVVWTGREVIVWGGRNEGGFHVTADGAAWNPATNKWTRLPASPLRARAGTIATWTGRRMVLLGGYPAVTTDTKRSYPDGATFDPATWTWRKLATAKSPDGHTIEWRSAVMTNHDLIAWSIWSTSTRVHHPNAAPGTVEYRRGGGGEMYRYDPDTGQWTLVPQTQESITEVEQALWTGQEVMVRGKSWCGCPGPWQPLATRIYRPATDTWTEVPADPLNTDGQTSAWANGLFSLSGGAGTSAWSPTTNTWRRLPSAPYYCGGGQQKPAFLDHRVVYWCPHTDTGPAAGHEGLAYTLAPTATPTPTR